MAVAARSTSPPARRLPRNHLGSLSFVSPFGRVGQHPLGPFVGAGVSMSAASYARPRRGEHTAASARWRVDLGGGRLRVPIASAAQCETLKHGAFRLWRIRGTRRHLARHLLERKGSASSSQRKCSDCQMSGRAGDGEMVGSGWGSPVYWAVDIAVDNFVDNRGAGTRIFRFGVSTAGGSLHPIFWVPAKSIVMFHVKPNQTTRRRSVRRR